MEGQWFLKASVGIKPVYGKVKRRASRPAQEKAGNHKAEE